jgi:hypothetical protein
VLLPLLVIVSALLLMLFRRVHRSFTRGSAVLVFAVLSARQSYAAPSVFDSIQWPSSQYFPRVVALVDWFIAAGVILLFAGLGLIGLRVLRKLVDRSSRSV